MHANRDRVCNITDQDQLYIRPCKTIRPDTIKLMEENTKMDYVICLKMRNYRTVLKT